MEDIERPGTIRQRWKEEGKDFRVADVNAEYDRQLHWQRRHMEDEALENHPYGPVADQIRDHRAAGNWTTVRHDPAPDEPAI